MSHILRIAISRSKVSSKIGWRGPVEERDQRNEPYITYIHTYIIGHYNPSIRIIDLVSHSTYVVCVNFIHKWRDLQFKVDFKRQIFWETFRDNFIFTFRVFARNLLRGNRRRNIMRILFWWGSNPGLSSNKPRYYLLDHCDFPFKNK